MKAIIFSTHGGKRIISEKERKSEARGREKWVGRAEDLLEVLTGNLEIKLFDLGIWPFRAVEFCAV